MNGCKEDKFERDIRLLTKGIEEEPNNGRYYFYLAQSYKDTNKYELAIENYKKRIEKRIWMIQWNLQTKSGIRTEPIQINSIF